MRLDKDVGLYGIGYLITGLECMAVSIPAVPSGLIVRYMVNGQVREYVE